ncbi:uncharacterized protein K444DRAFT_184719 [Hyaloscypha bicolor E]|uniref:BZIP domain-containing protein n=1 Tax=Hyaloscypha bicolor E TaxID=1095630 RepID=A0A2J6TRM2_9HELO|nr:uncharacterized protein K444DRAFT_184719 [Hyaloscypha bicolor E]PMD65664.1 hypothetical protein K444DRAFT_184719 [Hyaloscypha bicolor E]
MEEGLTAIDYPWVPYDEWNNSNPRNISPPASVSSPSTTTNTTPESVERHPPTCKCEPKDLAASKLQRRREQNRTSQQKFREKIRKDYEAVVQALEAERQMSARLRDEVTALHSTIECLAKGNQNCLETISRLCMSGFIRKGEGQAEIDSYGQLVCESFLPRMVDGNGMESI